VYLSKIAEKTLDFSKIINFNGYESIVYNNFLNIESNNHSKVINNEFQNLIIKLILDYNDVDEHILTFILKIDNMNMFSKVKPKLRKSINSNYEQWCKLLAFEKYLLSKDYVNQFEYKNSYTIYSQSIEYFVSLVYIQEQLH